MVKVRIGVDNTKEKINKEIYGHFSEHLGRCIYEGFWVGKDSDISNVNGIRKDVVEALKEISIPVLRWPGGCFADEYHWKDGIGPTEKRPTMINTHWGGVVENNAFGTHEFLELCDLIGAEPYIAGNVGSGSVREMSEWIEYMTFDGKSPMADLRCENGRKEPWKIKYFGVGNENWGCGGNMRPEYYADEYRRYSTYARNYGGNKLYKIAGGPNVDDYNWTEELMKISGKFMDGLSLHYYVIPGTWENKTSATMFDEKIWFNTLKKSYYMNELITNHSKIMDKYDEDKRVALVVDEWGAWYDVEPGTNPGFLYQQNTMRDAFIAAIQLNIFNQHCDRVKMANIAQTINVLQSVILTEGEKMVLTPTYHVFNMYKVHQDSFLLDSEVVEEKYYEMGDEKIPQISISSSRSKDGVVNITLCNLNPNEETEIICELGGERYYKCSGKIITASKINEYNDFNCSDNIVLKGFNEITIDNNIIKFNIPKMSIVSIAVEK